MSAIPYLAISRKGGEVPWHGGVAEPKGGHRIGRHVKITLQGGKLMSDASSETPMGDLPQDTSGHDWPEPLDEPIEEAGETLADDGTPGAVAPEES